MGWRQRLGLGEGMNEPEDGRRGGRPRGPGGRGPVRRRRHWGAIEPLEVRALMAIDWQSSDAVHGAIIRAGDLTQYTPQQMAQTTSWVIGAHPGVNLGQLGAQVSEHTVSFQNLINDAYIWNFPANVSAQNVAQQLGQLKGLDYFYPLVPVEYQNRAVPNDPYFGDQWHLQNTGANSSGGLPGADANVVGAWDIVTGAGVVIGIVDDGLQHTHPDLNAQYLPAFSYDFIDGDTDPAPGTGDFHGTSVAGVAAGKGNNAIGISGSAPDASLAGIRLVGGFLNDATVAAALSFHSQDIDIYNNSWGPGPFQISNNPLALAAMMQTATLGRGGLGSIITWAGGNEGGAFTGFDDVNFDLYANSIYTIAVGALTEAGTKSSYSDEGSALFISAYSNGGLEGITTTDRTGADGYNADGAGDGDPFPDNDYTSTFGGTSSATPLVSGVIALMLEANPSLNYRDVQEILVQTARKTDPSDSAWTVNGAGHNINYKYGFGAIDALPAVLLAQSWTGVGAPIQLSTGTIAVNANVPDNNAAGVSSKAVIPQEIKVERVEVVFDATHTDRGDLLVELISPDGTSSILAPVRAANTHANYQSWTFSSVRHWGETSQGDWELRVSDRDGNSLSGTFNSWKLNIYGTTPVAPTAVNDVANGFEDIPLAIPILANDTDVDGRIVPSSIQIVSQPANGTIAINQQTGVVTYTGKKDYFGPDTFSYRVADNTHAFSNVATVSIDLVNVNDAPVAVNDIGKALVGPIVVNVLDNDFDVDSPVEPSSIKIVAGPLSGTAVIDAVLGTITYTPPAGFAGGDILSYTITDSDGAVSNVATVKFRVGQPVTLAGQVYIDNNGNGVRDPGEQGLAGVLITLTKTDGPFTFTEGAISGANGAYLFAEADDSDKIYPTGVYTVTEVQPGAFLDGADRAGSHLPAFTLNDQFGGMTLLPGANSTDWTFAERGLKAEFLANYLGAQLFLASNNGGSLQSLAFSTSGGSDPLAALAGLPGISAFKLASDPPGLALGVNGQKSSSELVVVGVPGTTSALSAPAIQSLNGQTYIFDSWSDGGASNRTVAAGSSPSTLTAKYRVLQGPTTNYSYVLAVANKVGIASIAAEQLTQLTDQLAQGTPRTSVAATLWNTPENLGRRVDTLYQTLLHRPADAAGRSGYVARLLAGASENDLAAEMLAGVEYAQTGHLSPTAYVDGLYRDVLGRNADAAGRAVWVTAINQGKSRLEVAKAFLSSEERLGVVVEQFYRDVLGRGADAGGKAIYVGMLKSGSLSTASLGARMLASDEFANRATNSQLSASETALAKAVYTDLTGRAASAAELTSWSLSVSLGTTRADMIEQLGQTTDSLGRLVDQIYQAILHRPVDSLGRTENINRLLAGATEQEIAQTLLSSNEYAQSHVTNAAYVEGLYRDVLGRNSDAAGKASWVAALNQGRSRADIAASFLTSDERYLRQIDGYYTTYLGRAADAAGRSHYLSNLRQGTLTTASAIETMLASDEYFSRAGRRRL